MIYSKVTVYFTDGTLKEVNNVRRLSSTDEFIRFEHNYTNTKYEFNKRTVKFIESE